MPLNTLVYATQLQKALDASAVLGLTSGWMDANASQVVYNGGNKIRMPEMSTTGLKDYDRDDGYPDGSVTLSFKEYEMTMDRGTSFQLDAMDVNETNFIVNATSVCNTFQKEHVLPEIDAYRYSRIYALLKEAGRSTVVLCQEKVQVKRGLFIESMESYSTVFCDHVFQIIQFGYHLFTEFLNPIHDVFQQITQFCSLPNQCLHVFRLHPALPPFILSIPPLSPASHSNS